MQNTQIQHQIPALTIWRSLRGLIILGTLGWGLLINSYVLLFVLWHNAIRPLEFANHVAHWISLSAVMVAVLVLPFIRRWWLGVWLLPGVLMFGLIYGQHWLPQSTPSVEGVEITAATYNVLGHIADPDETLAVIEDMDADFVALQEFRPTLRYQLQTELGDVYPYQANRIVNGVDGLALLSKYPFVEDPQFHIPRNYQTTQPRYGRAVVDVHGQFVVLYTYHPNTPYFEPSAINIEQTRQMMGIVAQEPYPVLLMCDCNNTPLSAAYGLLDDQLSDSFMEQGFGFGLTFPAGGYDWGNMRVPDFIKPLIRIDYIWHSDPIVTLDAKVWTKGNGGTSDHYPVWARLVLPK